MKSHVLIRENGDWNLVSKQDANTYKQAGYEIITPFKFSKSILRASIPFGILVSVLLTINKLSNNDLRLGFLILILMRMLNLMKSW